MKIFVKPFRRDSCDKTFRKIYEELCEVTEAYAYYAAEGVDGDIYTNEVMLKMEIGDLLTAIINWCNWMEINPQECIDLAEVKNVTRGYYDTIDS